jgi:hypothetical protein
VICWAELACATTISRTRILDLVPRERNICGEAVWPLLKPPRTFGGCFVVANYLLAPGYFLDLSHAAGADVDTEPLAVPEGEVPPELVDVVVSRYRSVA